MPNIPDVILNITVCLDEKAFFLDKQVVSLNNATAFLDKVVHLSPPLEAGSIFIL